MIAICATYYSRSLKSNLDDTYFRYMRFISLASKSSQLQYFQDIPRRYYYTGEVIVSLITFSMRVFYSINISYSRVYHAQADYYCQNEVLPSLNYLTAYHAHYFIFTSAAHADAYHTIGHAASGALAMTPPPCQCRFLLIFYDSLPPLSCHETFTRPRYFLLSFSLRQGSLIC